MKKYLPYSLFIIVVVIAGLWLTKSKSIGLATAVKVYPGMAQAKEENETDEMDKLIEQEVMLTRDPATGQVPRERLIAAKAIMDQKFALQAMGRLSNAVAGISWVERGPNNIGGRTRTLLYDKNDATGKKVWAAGVGGGLWYTTDITAATPAWVKVNDLFDNIAVTSIVQDPTTPNTMYFGTGEGWFNIDAIRGLGIWKSTDGGVTWAQLTSTNNSTFHYNQKLIVTSTGTLLVATRTSVTSGTGGIYRSTDGGANFTKVLGAGVGGSTADRAADLEIAANDSIYCSMGIFSVDGIYRSANGGATWTKIYTSLSNEGRIELACAPSNSSVVYALVHNTTTNGIKKIMSTIDATVAVPTWTTKTNPTWCDQGSTSSDFTRTQAWYDLIAMVDPADQNTVFIGGVDIHKTTNGGTSWAQISQWRANCGTLPVVHADIHEFVVKPGTSGATLEFLVGNDGGVYRTVNAGGTYTERNTDYNVTQYYSCAIHPTLTNYFLAGAQDNGTQKFTTAGINTTTSPTGGDGAFAHIDQNNGNLQFTSFTGNAINVSTDGGNNFFFQSLGGGSFINPTDFDDRANIFYAANAAGSFKRWVNPGSGPSIPQTVTVSALGGGTITHISVSPTVANRIYLGTSNGRVVVINNAHDNSLITAMLLFTNPSTSTSVSCIAVDPANENHLLATYSNYATNSVYETTNGTTFTSVEGNLPDMPVRWAMFDPRNSDWALLATEMGVWSTDDISAATTDWDPTNTNFANVRVDMLQYRPIDGLIAAATHGRGLFTTIVPIPKSILFQSTGDVDTESSITGISDCRGYKDYTIPMRVTAAPSGNATVTLNTTGSTAISGVDFDFTTNGDFTSPSSQLTFNSGATTNQNFTLRVYDDAVVENEEAITFNFTVTGSTDAVKSNYNGVYNLQIKDNDVAPYAPAATSTNYSIGVNNATTYLIGVNTTGGIGNNRGRVQFLYSAAELKATGMFAGPISRLAFNVAQKNSSGAYIGFTVNMANTSNTSLSAGFLTTGLTQTYTGDLTTTTGVNTITFTNNFIWDGTSNVVVQFCYDNGATAISNDFVRGTGLLTNAYYQIARLQTTAGTACSLAAEYVYGDRMDITFTSTPPGTSVETALNATKTIYADAGVATNFYSAADNELLVKVENPGAVLGCVTARIDEADAANVWPAYSAGTRSAKVFEVTPSLNSGTTYTITLYYTNAELSGRTASTLKLLKTTAASAGAANSSNSVIVTPTVTNFNSYVGFTFTFTGFSRFFLTDNNVILPLKLISFTGKLNSELHSNLNWVTANETNTKEFVVEKSADGIKFEKLGTVDASGSTTSQKSYQFTDPSIAEPINYYRLKMMDINGNYTYSQVVVITNDKKVKGIFVVNNPFDTYIDVAFENPPGAKLAVRLINMNGRVHYTYITTIAARTLRLQLGQLQLPRSTYMLEVQTKDERKVFKVVKQ